MDRHEFIAVVSSSLGRTAAPEAVSFDSLHGNIAELAKRADNLRSGMINNSVNLIEPAVAALTDGGWQVHRAATVEDVGSVVSQICEDADVATAVRTKHQILDDSNIESVLAKDGIKVKSSDAPSEPTNLVDRRDQIESEKQAMFDTDVGITGGDYLIAETGTLVVHPGEGVARLASLAPPIHIAVAHSNRLLASLDDLFLLEHADLVNGIRASGMNLISGPSRTGDIEAQIVYGIHGPVEAHIILVG